MRWSWAGWGLGVLCIAGCPDDGVQADESGSTSAESSSGSDDTTGNNSGSETSNGSTGIAESSTGVAESSTGVGETSTGTDSGSTEGATSTTDGGTTEGTTSTTDGGTTEGSTTDGGTTDGGTTEGSTTDGGTTTEGTDSSGFIVEPDMGIPGECDLWAQDCPEGEKCMPFGEGGTGTWNATGCFPVDDNPGQPGDSCTVEGSGTSGVDSCDIGVMCWDVDPETNTGVCTAMCTNTPENPICTDADTTCVIANSGLIILCLPVCDPILQDCPDGQGCYPINDSFVCAPDVSGDQGAVGDPCEFINTCDLGNACISADAYGSGCVGVPSCCGQLCDVDDPPVCAELDQECVPWYEEGTAPMGLDHVGVCSVPA